MRGKAAPWMRFNEAAGFTQRKLTNREATYTAEFEASMRPPVLPSGNFLRCVLLSSVSCSLQ